MAAEALTDSINKHREEKTQGTKPEVSENTAEKKKNEIEERYRQHLKKHGIPDSDEYLHKREQLYLLTAYKHSIAPLHPDRSNASLEKKMLQKTVNDVRIRSRDYQRQYGTDSVFWIKQKPLYENRQYAQFLLPDGKNSIFIRQSDTLPGRDSGTGMRLAAIFKDQQYSMMNLEKVNVVAADGSKAIAMYKLPGGAVVAHGSQQPDKKKTGPEIAKGSQKKEIDATSRSTKQPEKEKSW